MIDFRTVNIIEYETARAERVSLSSLLCQGNPNRFIAFDTETTGLDPNHDRLTEVGAVLYENGRIINHFQSLIFSDVPVPERVSALNCITEEMLKTAPEEKDVLQRLVAFMGDAVYGRTLICGHVPAFDMSFLCHALNRAGISANFRFVDTRELAVTIPDLTSHSLSAVADYFKIPHDKVHRAKEDAILSGQIFLKILRNRSILQVTEKDHG